MPEARPSKKVRPGRDVDVLFTPSGTGKPLFSTLPTELVLLIISQSTLDGLPLDRQDTLFALSRTCRHLRSITLGMAWSTFEVTHSRYPGDWSKGLADDLERKSNILIGLTHLHPLVNTVTVILTRRRSDQVLPAFAACLSKLPNATKLVIAKAHISMSTLLRKGFAGHTFPQVREIELPPQAHNVLRLCPEARVVKANDILDKDASMLVSAIAKACPHVEEVREFPLDVKALMNLSKAAPNLRVIGRVMLDHFVHNDNDAVLEQLKSFKHLTDIWTYKRHKTFDEAARKLSCTVHQ